MKRLLKLAAPVAVTLGLLGGAVEVGVWFGRTIVRGITWIVRGG